MPLKHDPQRPKLTIGNAFRRLQHSALPPDADVRLLEKPVERADGQPDRRRRHGVAASVVDGDAAHAGAWRGRLKSWLGADVGECCESTLHSLKPSTRRKTALLDARTAFRAAIDDIPRPAGAGTTLEHIRASRSLHALWELRNELFSLISCHHDQGEATRRIAALDRHFSRRLRRAASKRAALQGSR